MGTSEDFVEQALNEADQMEIEKLKANADIAKIISSSTVATAHITVGGVDIRFKAFLDRKTRHKLYSTKDVDQENLDQVEGVMYDSLAAICIDPPFNSRETWLYIEEQGGDVSGILKKMTDIISKGSTNAKDFRKES